jgi:Spy/CpxP family protein refolding chaperone
MKSIFLSLFATAVILSANAQDNNSAKTKNGTEQTKEFGRRHKADHQQIAEKLNFTDSQKEQFKAINEDFKSKMNDLKENNLSADELKEKRQTLVKERSEKVQALLTPEQKQQMQEFRKEGKNKREMVGRNRMERMKSTLNLSDEQIAKMKAQREEYKSKAEVIKNNESLTANQKTEQLKSLQEERKNSFKNNLTPEQLQKLEKMKNSKPAKTS